MSSAELRTLLALRLAGFAETAQVASRAGLDDASTAAELRRAHAAGWVVRREGRSPGWLLTEAGRRRGEDLLADEHRAAGASAVIEAHYARFLVLNVRLLDVCTRWQVRPDPTSGRAVPNAHDDPHYDTAVLGDLEALHADAEPLLDELAAVLGRFEGYRLRLGHARDRVAAGDLDWFTRPLIDSYHSVWFELHEDLLATLGRDRSAEAAAGGEPRTRSKSPRPDR